MAQTTTGVGLQISLEISRIKPIRDVMGSMYTAVLDYGRKCRLSGSDVVVEEDLVMLLGRVLVCPELEDEYKRKVRIQSFVQLYQGCEVRLDAGAGPTVQEALRHHDRLATVIQLSMLAYFHNRLQLARTLSRIIAKRHLAQIQDAQPSPGEFGIAKVLESTSAQTCAFSWHIYSQHVEDKLRSSIPNFRYRREYSRLSGNTILGAVDFFCLVQSLPEDRRITLSSQAGCIPLILWAHSILQLTIIIKLAEHDDVVFGQSAEPHIYIRWIDIGSDQELPSAQMRLHDRNMEVYIDLKGYQDETERRFPMATEERHPVRGYGTTFLKRLLNVNLLIPEGHAVYEDAAKFVTMYAIRCAENLRFEHEVHKNPKYQELFRQPIRRDIGRIVTVGRVVFDGLPFDLDSISLYVQHYQDMHGDLTSEQGLPISFVSYIKDMKDPDAKAQGLVHLLKAFRSLIKVIVALSWVKDLGDIEGMPLLMQSDDFNSRTGCFDRLVDSPWGGVSLPSEEVATGVLGLLSKIHMTGRSARGGNMYDGIKRFLWSEFGWSVWLDGVFGVTDPADVKLQSVNVQRGVPTMHRTGERRSSIADGSLLPFKGSPDSHPIMRGETYEPRSAGTCGKRQEFWSVEEDHFELSVVYPVQPAAEWTDADGTEAFEVVFHCGDLHERLSPGEAGSMVYYTRACEHAADLDKSIPVASSTRLGPDSAIVVGWQLANPTRQHLPERVVVALTRGSPQLRWAALMGRWNRDPIVVTGDCCEECALTTACSLQGRWMLVL